MKVIDKPRKANAVRERLKAVKAAYYVLMDADGQHNPADAFMMSKNVETLKVDMMIGSRFLFDNEDDRPADLRGFFNKKKGFKAQTDAGRDEYSYFYPG